MTVCVYLPTGPLSGAVRECIENEFGVRAINLGELPVARWKDIVADADWLVADITAHNAAASYLTGIADALGKRSILLAPIAESIPAVFSERAVIVHQWNIEHLRSELRKVAAPGGAANSTDIADDSPAGKFHQRFGDLLKAHR